MKKIKDVVENSRMKRPPRSFLKLVSLSLFSTTPIIIGLLFISLPAWGQYPAGLPSATPSAPSQESPSKPLTLIIKDVSRNDLFRLVITSLKQSQRVKPLVMRRAQRGFVEYGGYYSGDRGSLADVILQSVGGKVHVTSRPIGESGLEIIVSL